MWILSFRGLPSCGSSLYGFHTEQFSAAGDAIPGSVASRRGSLCLAAELHPAAQARLGTSRVGGLGFALGGGDDVCLGLISSTQMGTEFLFARIREVLMCVPETASSSKDGCVLVFGALSSPILIMLR